MKDKWVLKWIAILKGTHVAPDSDTSSHPSSWKLENKFRIFSILLFSTLWYWNIYISVYIDRFSKRLFLLLEHTIYQNNAGIEIVQKNWNSSLVLKKLVLSADENQKNKDKHRETYCAHIAGRGNAWQKQYGSSAFIKHVNTMKL